MKDNIFDKANDFIRNSESSLVNLLSAIAPWGAPLAPATMSYSGMVKHLSFSEPVAGIIACVIEILGLATVHTTLLFWQHNRRYTREYKKMPTILAAGMFGLYLVIILGVNVILEAYAVKLITWAWTPIVARAMLSLLAVPAAVTMAIRTQHTELLHEIQSNRKSNQPQPAATNPQPVVAKSNRVRILELHYAQPDLKSPAIADEIGVSRQYVDKVISKNGLVK
jgi:hypothetical protein